jgi:hypothetical protein
VHYCSRSHLRDETAMFEKTADADCCLAASRGLRPRRNVFCIRLYDHEGVVTCVPLRNIALMLMVSWFFWGVIYYLALY